MKKEIRTVKDQILQITTIDERWYARPTNDPATGLPTYQYVPSVTYITSFYPKGVAFYKWLANTGWNEAEALKNAGGDRGTKVHQALLELLDGKMVAMGASYVTGSTAGPAELSIEEYSGVMAFVAWWGSVIKETGFAPRVLNREFVVWHDAEGYAGTIDLLCEIYNPATKAWELWIMDFKTGQYVWPDMECQLSGYKAAFFTTALRRECRLAILQLGYQRNKASWKFTEVTDQYDLFLAAKRIWAKETEGEKPKQRDYPLVLQLPPATPVPITPPSTNVPEDQLHRTGARLVPRSTSRRTSR